MYPALFPSKNNKVSSGTCCLNLPREHIQKYRESCPLESNMKKLIKAVAKGSQVFQSYVALLFTLQGGEKYKLLCFIEEENVTEGP